MAGRPARGAAALWRCGAVALWRCGAVALWRCGAVALWRCGAVALWRNDKPLKVRISAASERNETLRVQNGSEGMDGRGRGGIRLDFRNRRHLDENLALKGQEACPAWSIPAAQSE
jgi:hypothetical protein